MVMLIDPLRDAINAARAAGAADSSGAKVIYLSPQGTRLDQAKVRELAAGDRVILLCGRYEAVDERLIRGTRSTRRFRSAITCSRAANWLRRC